MGHTIELLAPEQRIIHYRAMALEVQALAHESKFDEVRARLLTLVESWKAIANTMERDFLEHRGEQIVVSESLSVTWPAIR